MIELARYLANLRNEITALIQDARDPRLRPEEVWARAWRLAAEFVEYVMRRRRY